MNSHDQAAHPQDTTDNTRASEGNDQVIRVAANLLKKVMETNFTVVKEVLCNNYQSCNLGSPYHFFGKPNK